MATEDQTVLEVVDFDEANGISNATTGRNVSTGSGALVHPLGVGADAKAAVRHHLSQVSIPVSFI